MPPIEYPTNAGQSAEAPLLFPSNSVDVDVRQSEGVAPPPSEFPTNQANVIRIGNDAYGRSGAVIKNLPPLVFPTDRTLYKIKMPTEQTINETLSKLKVSFDDLLRMEAVYSLYSHHFTRLIRTETEESYVRTDVTQPQGRCSSTANQR